jgi:hypothetical protein
LELANPTSDKAPRPREAISDNYKSFLHGIRETDNYGRRLAVRTPKQFEAFAEAEDERLLELISSTTGTSSIKLYDWVPTLTVRDWLRFYPWVVAAGLGLIALLLRRLIDSLSDSNAEFDSEDPGFPAHLVLPVPLRTGLHLSGHAIARILLALPFLLASTLVYFQLAFSQGIVSSMKAPAHPMEVISAAGKVYSIANQVAEDIQPSGVEYAGLAVAFILLIVVLRRFALVVSLTVKKLNS